MGIYARCSSGGGLKEGVFVVGGRVRRGGLLRDRPRRQRPQSPQICRVRRDDDPGKGQSASPSLARFRGGWGDRWWATSEAEEPRGLVLASRPLPNARLFETREEG